eukprot:Gb_41510 [translate_table: standard]
MPNGGVPLEEVECQQGVRIKREYMVNGLHCGSSLVWKTLKVGVGVATQIGLQVVCVVAKSPHVRVDARIVVAIHTRLTSTVAGYLGVSVDGSKSICNCEISFMDMGCVHQ